MNAALPSVDSFFFFIYKIVFLLLRFGLLMKLLILYALLVMSLKRLLVGSISLSDDSQLDEENGEDQSDNTSQEIDHPQLTGKHVCVCVLALISFLAD